MDNVFNLRLYFIIALNVSTILDIKLLSYLPNSQEWKDMLNELFDNKLYSNTLNGDVGGHEVTTTSGNINGESSEVVSNNHNETGDADSFSAVRDIPECQHITNPDAPNCDCPHDGAEHNWRISTHHDRCHECSEAGSTAVCYECRCLFHPECLPDHCEFEERPSSARTSSNEASSSSEDDSTNEASSSSEDESS